MKKLLFLLFVITILILSTSAASYNTYPYQGTFSSSLLQVLRDVAQGVSPMPYVAWRDNENDYCIFFSDSLTVNGTTFSAEAGTIVTVSQVSRTEYFSSYIDYYKRDLDSFSLSTNNILVYSNLSVFPTLSDKEVIYHDTYIFIAVLVLLVYIITRMFRSRSCR